MASRKPASSKPATAIDIGIAAGDRARVAEGLSRFLADSYTLYLKTHNFHWNVTGPMFNSLHLMFMDQYNEQWMALDQIAERIRALGFNAPGSYAEFAKLSSIDEQAGAEGRHHGCGPGPGHRVVVEQAAAQQAPRADTVDQRATRQLEEGVGAQEGREQQPHIRNRKVEFAADERVGDRERGPVDVVQCAGKDEKGQRGALHGPQAGRRGGSWSGQGVSPQRPHASQLAAFKGT